MKKLFMIALIFVFINAVAGVHKVDTSKNAYLPDSSWKIISNEDMGQIEIDPSSISFLKLDKKFLSSKEGNALSANILDFFLENPEIIPNNWKDKRIIFSGTLYADPSGGKLFRVLKFEGEWSWGRFYPEDEIVFDNLYVITIKK